MDRPNQVKDIINGISLILTKLNPRDVKVQCLLDGIHQLKQWSNVILFLSRRILQRGKNKKQQFPTKGYLGSESVIVRVKGMREGKPMKNHRKCVHVRIVWPFITKRIRYGAQWEKVISNNLLGFSKYWQHREGIQIFSYSEAYHDLYFFFRSDHSRKEHGSKSNNGQLDPLDG